MLYSLQALRAFAAWVVVCHHFMQIFFDFHASGPIGQLLADRGAVGVDIFFVISGLVIYLSTRDKDIAPGSSCSTAPCASSRPTGSTPC
jgi:peptidoglycan/LPS O-acetylase OafA/YrhL